METQNHLLDALARRHIDQEELKMLWELSRQAMGAVTALLRYLQTSDGPRAIARPIHKPRA